MLSIGKPATNNCDDGTGQSLAVLTGNIPLDRHLTGTATNISKVRQQIIISTIIDENRREKESLPRLADMDEGPRTQIMHCYNKQAPQEKAEQE
jgi:hypothetical protein